MLSGQEEISFSEVDITGHKLIGAISKLGKIGPKHHAIVLGSHPIDGKVYIAESMNHGYRLETYENFVERYRLNGKISLVGNDGKLSNVSVARRALSEIIRGGDGIYNLVTNNCESFANRAMHGHSTSSQVVNTAIGLTIATAGLIWIAKKSKQNAAKA